jgi:D-3-phosphoglycerate dehydrogenase
MCACTLRSVPKAHVLLLESIHTSAQNAFNHHEIAVHRHDGGLGENELIARLSELAAKKLPLMLGIRSKSQVTAAVFEKVPELIAVGAFCIGTDQIDLEAAKRAACAVFNAPFSNTRSVAELVLAEIIMLSRQVFQRSMAAHQGRWMKTATGSHEVRGKTLGIIGYGHIGSQLSVLAESLGMRVIYYDVVPKLPLGNAQAMSSLEDLLGAADFVSLHVPDTELTRGMFDHAAIEAMKRGSYLINASRGNVVDIEALREGLLSGQVGGAAIDVFPREPESTNQEFASPLRGLENVILTPHIGGSTQEAQANIGIEVSQKLSNFVVAGNTLGNLAVPELDLIAPRRGVRIYNLHQNAPGAASAFNRCVAESGFNIEAQQLSTREDLGVLSVDLAVERKNPALSELIDRLNKLSQTIRTRLIG